MAKRVGPLFVPWFTGEIPMNTSLGFRRSTLQFVIAVMAAIGLVGCQTNDFKSKYKKIQMDMTEAQVDVLLVDYPPNFREELTASEREFYGPPDGPCTRTPFIRKHYAEKPDAIERDYFIEVYFDDNYMVVHKLISEYVK
jgi:hypothetical protein